MTGLLVMSGDLSDQSLDVEALTKRLEGRRVAEDNDGNKNNCVAFAIFFLRRFTTVLGPGETIPGNGKDIAGNLARIKGLPSSSTPFAISVFSQTNGTATCNGAPCGHTGIVIAVNGDDVVTIEAAIEGHYGATIRHRRPSDFVNGVFTNINGVLDRDALNSMIGK